MKDLSGPGVGTAADPVQIYKEELDRTMNIVDQVMAGVDSGKTDRGRPTPQQIGLARYASLIGKDPRTGVNPYQSLTEFLRSIG